MLRKTVKIDGIDVPFQASAATPRYYRAKFQRDIYKDIQKLESSFNDRVSNESELEIDDLEIFENVAYIMAYQANPTIPEMIEDWLDQFEMFSIYEVLPEILELWGKNMYSESVTKKNTAALSAN